MYLEYISENTNITLGNIVGDKARIQLIRYVTSTFLSAAREIKHIWNNQ